jgi:3-isopropylmalate/(R)-2-methylmalate dehydratase small subunit
MLLFSNKLNVRRFYGVVSTDDILPARYKHQHVDPSQFGCHVFENLRPGWVQTVRPGDIIVSDDVFGIGSSREQAVTALSAAGIVAVIAPAFGNIFFRNAWNTSLPALEMDIPDVKEGEEVHIDLGAARLVTARGEVRFRPPPELLLEVMRAGGLLAAVAARTQTEPPVRGAA